MKDVTDLVIAWSRCSHDVWTRWFKPREDGWHEFIDVDEALFSALVIEQLDLYPLSTKQFLSSTWVNFNSGLDAERTVFVRQKHGGTFGKRRRVELDSGTRCKVVCFNSTEMPIDGTPSMDLELGREFFEEPICDAPSYRIEYDPQS